jgi:hypothetical protein
LTLTEVCSLYMSRALLAAMPGAAFSEGLAALLAKIEKSLGPRLREFLDQLPGVIHVKPGARKKHQRDYDEIIARPIDASAIAKRRCYYSASSNRERTISSSRIVAYFDGGLYLVAHAPDRQSNHAERIRRPR